MFCEESGHSLQELVRLGGCQQSFDLNVQKDPQQGREAAAPSNIREIQEIQGGKEAPHNSDAISPKDA
jgi:hypothetical protein